MVCMRMIMSALLNQDVLNLRWKIWRDKGEIRKVVVKQSNFSGQLSKHTKRHLNELYLNF